MNLLLLQGSPCLPAYHGASLSNRLMLEALAARGHRCRVIAPAHLDEPGFGAAELRDLLARKAIVATAIADGVSRFRHQGVEVYAVDSKARIHALAESMARELDTTWAIVSTEDPGQVLLEDVLRLFGGRVIYTAHTPMLVPADAASPFGNRSKAALLTRVAAILAVSQFAKAHIDRLISAHTVALPLLQFGHPPFPNHGRTGTYVTMINPSALKGISLFLEIAQRMPHVRFAAVAAWGTGRADRRALARLSNVTLLEPSEDVDSFYAQTRLLLVPSLCPEGHPRVITEALLRGIPVVASDVGGIPGAMLGVGRLIPVRPITRYTERFDRQGRWMAQPEIPEQDAEPWCRAIDDLVSDRARFESLSDASHAAADAYVRTHGIDVVERFLEGLASASSEPAEPPIATAVADVDVEPAAAVAQIRQLSPQKKAAVIALLKRRGLLRLDRRSIPRQPRAAIESLFPVSPTQQQLWIVEQLMPGGTAYNLPTALRLRGHVDAVALGRSLTALVARHEILRTSFPTVDGEPMQRVAAHLPVAMRFVDLRRLADRVREPEARRLIRDEAMRPFNLADGPLLRMGLLALAPDQHVLLFTVHHLIADGASTTVLVRDLTELYEAFLTGRPPSLPELPVQYADYTMWERAELVGGLLNRELTYWRQQLTPPPPALELPGSKPRATAVTGARHIWRGAHLRRRAEQLAGALQALAQAQRASLFMILVSALQALLRLRTGAGDLVVGTDVSGRDREELEHAIGLFVNQIVLCVRAIGNPTFTELVERVKQVTLDARAHAHVPFERVVAAINPERRAGSQPLFQVKLMVRNPTGDALRVAGGLSLEPESVREPTANLDLFFNVAQIGTTLDVTLEYDADRYDEAFAEQLVDDYLTILRSAALDADQRLSALGERVAESRRTRADSRHAVYEESFRSKARQIRRRESAALPMAARRG